MIIAAHVFPAANALVSFLQQRLVSLQGFPVYQLQLPHERNCRKSHRILLILQNYAPTLVLILYMPFWNSRDLTGLDGPVQLMILMPMKKNTG
jgi:hypothetical protein